MMLYWDCHIEMNERKFRTLWHSKDVAWKSLYPLKWQGKHCGCVGACHKIYQVLNLACVTNDLLGSFTRGHKVNQIRSMVEDKKQVVNK